MIDVEVWQTSPDGSVLTQNFHAERVSTKLWKDGRLSLRLINGHHGKSTDEKQNPQVITSVMLRYVFYVVETVS